MDALFEIMVIYLFIITDCWLPITHHPITCHL